MFNQGVLKFNKFADITYNILRTETSGTIIWLVKLTGLPLGNTTITISHTSHEGQTS